MMASTFSGAKNSAGEMVPAFIRAKASIASWLPEAAASSAWSSGGGGSSLASSQVKSYIAFTRASRVRR